MDAAELGGKPLPQPARLLLGRVHVAPAFRTSIHLPVPLWIVVGLAYAADDVRSARRRMDFIRFTGEWFIYYVLIALGGGVLIAFMFGTFEAIGISPEHFITQWLLPCGAAAALVVAGWLVEAR